MIVSVRTKGKSIPEITEQVIGKKSRILFIIFVWFALILVVAVFYHAAIKTFIGTPKVVIPTLALIPISIVVGILIYKSKLPAIPTTLLGLVLLIIALYLGNKYPVILPWSKNTVYTFWLSILILYTCFASVLPVWVMLQPRDYMSSFLLFFGMGVGIIGMFISQPSITAPAFKGFIVDGIPLWPMLFIIVACGSVSGFHSLIASGTSCKQLEKESHAKRIGFGAMLTEGLVAAFVTLTIVAGLSWSKATPIALKSSPISAFAKGYSIVAKYILGGMGGIFCACMVNTFVVSTLDSCVRLGRLITAELFGPKLPFLKLRWPGTLMIVIPSALLAWSGKFSLIWPIFGASNQLVAALTLIVISAYLVSKNKSNYFTLYPAIFMLITTIVALSFKGYTFCCPGKGKQPNYILAFIAFILLVMSIVMTTEAWKIIQGKKENL